MVLRRRPAGEDKTKEHPEKARRPPVVRSGPHHGSVAGAAQFADAELALT